MQNSKINPKIVKSDKVLKKNIDGLEKVKLERDDFKNKYLRALADYQNLEKRIRDQNTHLANLTVANTILKLIPFLDDLEKAEIFIKDAGMKMVKDKFNQVLKDMGVEELEVLDKQFDPVFAEAIEVIPGEKENNVVEVLRKGYKFNNKVIRPAQVKVSKKL